MKTPLLMLILLCTSLACGNETRETCGPGDDTTDEVRLVLQVGDRIVNTEDQIRVYESAEQLEADCETCLPQVDVDLAVADVVVVNGDQLSEYLDATDETNQLTLYFSQGAPGGAPDVPSRQFLFSVPKERAVDVSFCMSSSTNGGLFGPP
jgi:hypothetical protein